MGTWPHDEAIKLAERATLRVNPINGTLEGLIGEPPAATPSAGGADPLPSLVISYLAGVGYTLADLTDGLGHRSRGRRRGDGRARRIGAARRGRGWRWTGKAARCSTSRPASRSTPSARSTASQTDLSTRPSTKINRSSRLWTARRRRCSSPSSRTTRNCAASSRAVTSPRGAPSFIPNNASTSSQTQRRVPALRRRRHR